MTRIELKYPEHTVCSHELTVRINDLSQAAHLGFDRLVNLLNEASATFLSHLGIDLSGDRKIEIIFADLAVQYLSEAFRGDRLIIEMAVGEVSSKGFEVYFKVRNRQTSVKVALAKVGVVFFDYKKRCTLDIPMEIREKLY